jgi:hypothetical protein
MIRQQHAGGAGWLWRQFSVVAMVETPGPAPFPTVRPTHRYARLDKPPLDFDREKQPGAHRINDQPYPYTFASSLCQGPDEAQPHFIDREQVAFKQNFLVRPSDPL